MRILALNTVGDACEAGVWDDEILMSHVHEPMAKGHDIFLPNCTRLAIEKVGVSFASIDRIAVVSGPGSFTGVRVGVAFARGLGVALGIPVVGISSLEAALPEMSLGRVLVALPAKLRPPDLSWWAQIFENGRRTTDPIEADQTQITQMAAQCDAVFGQKLEIFSNIGDKPAIPNLERVAKWAREAETHSIRRADPHYVREPDAVPMRKEKNTKI